MMLFVTFSTAEVKMGGVLKVVLDADPPTLDPHASTTTLVFVVGYHMFEGLYVIPPPFCHFLLLLCHFRETCACESGNLVFLYTK